MTNDHGLGGLMVIPIGNGACGGFQKGVCFYQALLLDTVLCFKCSHRVPQLADHPKHHQGAHHGALASPDAIVSLFPSLIEIFALASTSSIISPFLSKLLLKVGICFLEAPFISSSSAPPQPALHLLSCFRLQDSYRFSCRYVQQVLQFLVRKLPEWALY